LRTQLFNEISTSTNNSLNPRPELLLGTDEDLPVQVSHYLQDLGPKGGQGAMRLFIDLSLKFAQWFSMLAFSQSWVILAVWARKAFRTPAKSLVLFLHILYLKMVCLHSIILEMGSFQMSVVNSFCVQP
jgi:hypothetical protein